MQGGGSESGGSVKLVSGCATVGPGMLYALARRSPAHLEFRNESDWDGNSTNWLTGSHNNIRPRSLFRMTSLHSDGGASDESSELPTPYRDEDDTLEGEAEEADKLERMLNLLREEEEEEDPSAMLPAMRQAARSKDDMYLPSSSARGWGRLHCQPRRRAMSCSFPSITEEVEEEEKGDVQWHVESGDKGEKSDELEKGPAESFDSHVVKDLASSASPNSTGNRTQGQGHLLTTPRNTWGHPCRSRNSILLDILGDSSGSESEQPGAWRTVWRKTQSLHSVSSSEEGGVLNLLGSRNEMDAEEMLISLGFCDFDSPELIPDRLIPDSVAHARPSVMAQETVDEEPPLCLVEPTNEVPEELELSLPLGATAEDCLPDVTKQVKGRVRSTLPIPISALPDTPYYPFHGQPLDTVMEETDSQLSPIGSPRMSPHASLDHTPSESKPASGNLLSVPPLHRASLPSMAPSREGYKLSLELPGRDVCKLNMPESGCREVRRLSMDSHHSFQSADTIYFSVTSYDDAPEPPGGGVEGSGARSRSGSRSPSPRARRKAVATTPPPPTTVLKWLNSQVDEDITEVDQPWPFSELLSPERGWGYSLDGHLLDLPLLGPDKESTTQVPTPTDSSGSFITCQEEFGGSGSVNSDDSCISGSTKDARHTHRFSQASTVVELEDGSGVHHVSSASTILSSSHHRLSADSSITMVTRSHSGSPQRETRRRSSLYTSELHGTPPPAVAGTEDVCPQSLNGHVPSTVEADDGKGPCEEPVSLGLRQQTSATLTYDLPTLPTEPQCTATADTAASRQPVANCMPPSEAAAAPNEESTLPHQSEVLASSVTVQSGTAWDGPAQVLGSGCVGRHTPVRSPSPHRQPTDHGARKAAKEEPSTCNRPLSVIMQAEEEIPQTLPSEKSLQWESTTGPQVKPSSQVLDLMHQVSLLRESVEQKDSTIDELTHSHEIEAGELRKQVEHYRQQLTEAQETLSARLATVEKERDALSLQVREADTRHKTQLASAKQQYKRRTTEEIFDLRAKLNQEKQAEVSKVCAKAQRDLDDLKQQLAARGHEMARVKSFAQEREGAADALAEELQQLRKESADREVKLREALQAESRRVEKQLAREKALIVVKTQEVAAANHQRELMEVRDRIMEEKQAALAELKQQHAAQVEELTRKLHAREEEKRSLVLQLEDSRQSAAVAREEASRQLKQQLHEMRGALDSERQQNRSLLAEKQAAVARARDTSRQCLEEELSALQGRLEREHRSEVERLQEKLTRAEGEVLKRRGREQELQQREKELAMQLEGEELELMRSVSEECQRVALLLGRRHSRHLPPGSTRMSAVSLLRNSVEDLRVHVSELRQQADRDRAALARAHKDKAVELRQLKTELQIDKSQALKAQEERLRGEVRSGWVPLGTAVEQATRGCQTVGSSKSIPPETDAARLEASLKEEVQRNERMRGLLGERSRECSVLQQQLKQLSKEHLILQKELNASNGKPMT